MEKKVVNVAGFNVTQLNKKAYEAENTFQNLDFYFDVVNSTKVEVYVFDSLLPTVGSKEPCLAVFHASSLEEAVNISMQITKTNIKEWAEWM